MSGAEPEDEKISWSLEFARSRISEELKKGPPDIKLGEKLLSKISNSWETFTIKEESGQTFKGGNFHFSEAYRIFEDHESYLEIRLADYAADSSAWLNILNRYLQAEQSVSANGKTIVPSPVNQVFAWTWTDSQSGISHLESGGFFRYHLNLRTNLPEGKKVLELIFREFEWQSLTKI